MYTSYWGFHEKPFNLTPDPRFFYENPVYREAYANLLYAIQERKGFSVLIGEVGTGKTTLLLRLMDQLASSVRFAFVYNTRLSFDDLLSFMCEEFLLSVKDKSRVEKIQALNEFLMRQLRNGSTAALLIDEAQNLDKEALENLRLLSNLETRDEKLLQIILVGQPELLQKLDDPGLRQVKQRIAVWIRLSRLKEKEVGDFIRHRLRTVGYKRRELFTARAIRQIVLLTRGLPRLINIVCDNALVIAYAKSKKKVSPEIVREVASDLRLGSGDPYEIGEESERDWTLGDGGRGRLERLDYRRSESRPLARGAGKVFMTDLKASIKQLEPAPFVGENIEIRTTSEACAADLLVICPTGIFLGAREENLARAQRALGGLIRDAWPEGEQPTLRSAILAGDSTRLFQLIENAKDEVSKGGAIKLLDFLGIYHSNLSGTWLETEPPTGPDDSGAYEDELRRKREAAALGEIESGTESQYGNDSYAARSKKQNIAALATIAGTLVLAGVALWIVYPRFASPPKPRQETPASLFVPSQPGGSAGGDAGAGSKREPGVETAGSNFSHEGAQGAELEAGRITETESRTESVELQRGKLIDSPILAGQELRHEQAPKEKTAGPDFTASGAGTAVEPIPEPKPRTAGGIRVKPVDSPIAAAPQPEASQPKRSASRIAEAPRVEPKAQLETTRAEKPRAQKETPRLASGTAPLLRPAEPGLYETTRPAEVRDSAGARARVIDEIPAGTRLRVTGSQGDWLVVRSRTKNMTVYIKRNDAMRLAKTQQQADTSALETKWPEIQNRIGHAIAQRGVQGVRVAFIGDTAYLKGTVKTERERERAEIAAREIPEVKRVTNWISVDRSWNPFSGFFGG